MNRFTTNYFSYSFYLDKVLSNESSITEPLIPGTFYEIEICKDVVPVDWQERLGIKDITSDSYEYLNNVEISKILLNVANSSIYDTYVVIENGKAIYRGKIDNESLFANIIIADFIVNICCLLETNNVDTVELDFTFTQANRHFKNTLAVYLMKQFPNCKFKFSDSFDLYEEHKNHV